MASKTSKSEKALTFIQEMNELGEKYWKIRQISHIMTLLKEDLQNKSINESNDYLEDIFFSIPPSFFPYLLDDLTKFETGDLGKKIILYLLRTDRPIYQIKALQMIIKRDSDNFAPYIIPLIFSSHIPLKRQAIQTILKVPGSAELILEQTLNDRSEKRKKLAFKLLRKLNPENHKIAQKMLDSDDFIDRISAIQLLAKTRDKKWLSTIESMIKDPDIAVKKAAIEGISQLGGKKAKKILQNQLEIQDFAPLRQIILNFIENLNKVS